MLGIIVSRGCHIPLHFISDIHKHIWHTPSQHGLSALSASPLKQQSKKPPSLMSLSLFGRLSCHTSLQQLQRLKVAANPSSLVFVTSSSQTKTSKQKFCFAFCPCFLKSLLFCPFFLSTIFMLYVSQ